MPNDPINPDHYKNHPSGVECIQITRHMTSNLGQAFQYIWRHGQKAGEDAIQDLTKAKWFIEDEIKRLEEIERNAHQEKFDFKTENKKELTYEKGMCQVCGTQNGDHTTETCPFT